MRERWVELDVDKAFDGRYMISTFGNLKRNEHTVAKGKGKTYKASPLKWVGNPPYFNVSTTVHKNDGTKEIVSKTIYQNHEVARHFVPNPNPETHTKAIKIFKAIPPFASNIMWISESDLKEKDTTEVLPLVKRMVKKRTAPNGEKILEKDRHFQLIKHQGNWVLWNASLNKIEPTKTKSIQHIRNKYDWRITDYNLFIFKPLTTEEIKDIKQLLPKHRKRKK